MKKEGVWERVKRMRKGERPLVKGGRSHEVPIVAALWSNGKGILKRRKVPKC